jgi:hypothetical protein
MPRLEQAAPAAPAASRSLIAPLLARIHQAHLVATLTRLAAVLGRCDQADLWPPELLSLARRARRQPAQAATEVLALHDGRDSFASFTPTYGGTPFRRPGRERRQALALSRLRWRLYQQALALWHATKVESPLNAIDDGAPVRLLADYGAGCEVWRRGRVYVVRHDVGAHVSCWREDRISRREAEQALLGPEHFLRMTTALQRRLQARGADLYAGSTRPLPPPVFE